MPRITDYTALTTPEGEDALVIVDVSDTTMSAQGTTKQITVGNLVGAAVRPSGDASGVTDSAAINAAVSVYGTAVLGPGIYYMNATAGPFTTNQWVVCQPGVRINWKGTGDCFRWVDTSTYDDRITTGGGLIGRPVIDGTSSGAGSCGLHVGDVQAFRYDVAIQNFDGTGDIGAHFDNQNYWTEESIGDLWLSNCTQHLVFDVSGEDTSTNSFGYTDMTVEILAKVGQDGVVCQNGAVPYNGALRIRANFQGSASAQSNAVLRITGQVPAGHTGDYSALRSMRLDIQAECSDALGSNAPYTIYFGTLSSNAVLGCAGILDFAQGNLAFQESNWTATGATGFYFDGVIRGDFNLNNATVGLSSTYSFITQAVRSYGKALLNVTTGNVQADVGDFFSSTLAGDITISLNPGGAAALASAQRKTIIITQAASGGPYTVTWPKPGSPSTTDCAVYWPGGSTPAMSTGAGAVDVYNLITYDGIHWYGEALQAMS